MITNLLRDLAGQRVAFLVLFFGLLTVSVVGQETINDGESTIEVPVYDADNLPTVTSDKEDYAPGETAIITGTGWVYDSFVDVHFEEEPAHDHHHGYHDTKVDENGNWRIEYPIEERHLGVKFTAIVVGKTTGHEERAYFTDRKINFTTTGLPDGLSITVTFSPEQSSNFRTFLSPGPADQDVVVNDVSFYYSYPESVFSNDGTEY